MAKIKESLITYVNFNLKMFIYVLNLDFLQVEEGPKYQKINSYYMNFDYFSLFKSRCAGRTLCVAFSNPFFSRNFPKASQVITLQKR